MKQPGTKPRRSKPNRAAAPRMSLRRRALALVLFLGGGGAAVILGIDELASWVNSLAHGDAVIETNNTILGFGLLGFSMLLLALEFLIPGAVSRWSEERRTFFGKAILGTMLIGLVLVLFGQVVITITMQLDGYRNCYVGGRGRFTEVIWARGDLACPQEMPGR